MRTAILASGRLSGDSALPMGRYLPHLLALAVFGALAWAWAAFSWPLGVEHFKTTDTTGVFYEALRQEWASHGRPAPGQAWDWGTVWQGVFADQRALLAQAGFAELYERSILTYLGTVYRLTGDVTLGYKVLVLPLNLVFMLGAYLLLLRLVDRWWLAALLAVLASLPIALPLAGEYFGEGPVTIWSRRNLFTAFVPLLVVLYLQAFERPARLALVFLLVGLSANLHASGILLGEILVFAWLLAVGCRPRTCLQALGFGIATLMGGAIAFGGLWTRLSGIGAAVGNWLSSAAAAASGDPAGLLQAPAIPEEFIYLFYPLHIYAHWPAPLLHTVSLLALVLPVAVLWWWRRRAPDRYRPALFGTAILLCAFLTGTEQLHILLLTFLALALGRGAGWGVESERVAYLVIACFYVSFGGMLLFQAGHGLVEGFPLVFNQLRGVRFLGLFVFMLLAVALARIDWPRLRTGARTTLVLAAVLVLFWDLRHVFRSYIHGQPDAQTIALVDAARWARAETPVEARFLIASATFGVLAEREVYASDKDSRRAAGRLLSQTVAEGGIVLTRFMHDGAWDYLVVPRGETPPSDALEPVYDNAGFVILSLACRRAGSCP